MAEKNHFKLGRKMNREELHKLCSSKVVEQLDPLSQHIFVETTLKESPKGWTSEMSSMAKAASDEFDLFLKEMISANKMIGIASKTFSRLWQNEFQDKLWSLRKKVSHHAFLKSESSKNILHLCRRIIGACSHTQSISEGQLIARLYLMDWFHCTRTGTSLTGMNWFVEFDEQDQLILRSPDWDVLKVHFNSRILSQSPEYDCENQILISMSDAESKRHLEQTLSHSGKDALDIIVIKTKSGLAPWKPTFPIKSLLEGYCPDFGWLDLEFLATVFPKSKVFDERISVPKSIENVIAA